MLFLVVLFLLKTTSIFEKKETSQESEPKSGLTYNNLPIQDLVNLDTDSDGITDWVEKLYGLDPTKKETTPGILDSVVIDTLKIEQGVSDEINGTDGLKTEKLTETEKFSRELLATMVSLSQNGNMDPTTIDSIASSLAEKIQNPIVRKVFSASDIKIINDDSKQAIKKYFDEMNNIQRKYPIKESVASILQKFIIDENNVDSSVLVRLDPGISQTQKIIDEILKINVPQSLLSLHLDLLNAGERSLENISDMKFFDNDPIIAMGGMSKYQENVDSFASALNALIYVINQKLNN